MQQTCVSVCARAPVRVSMRSRRGVYDVCLRMGVCVYEYQGACCGYGCYLVAGRYGYNKGVDWFVLRMFYLQPGFPCNLQTICLMNINDDDGDDDDDDNIRRTRMHTWQAHSCVEITR